MEYIEKDHRLRVGDEIKTRRLLLKMTQQQLSEKVGIQQCNLARIEAGRYNITIDNLQKIADALSCDVSLVLRH